MADVANTCCSSNQVATPTIDTGLSDRSLLRRLREGDQQAATGLYRRYASRLRALVKARCSAELARKIEPDDVVQSVFGAFFQKAQQGFYWTPKGEDLWGLLMVITLNKIRNKAAFFSAAKRHTGQTFTGEDFHRYLDHVESDDSACQFLHMVVREAMADLPEKQMNMIELRLEGFEIAEIAEKTQRSKRTVERILQEFRDKLDGILKQDA